MATGFSGHYFNVHIPPPTPQQNIGISIKGRQAATALLE